MSTTEERLANKKRRVTFKLPEPFQKRTTASTADRPMNSQNVSQRRSKHLSWLALHLHNYALSA